jgi:nucleoside-diphosphate-sugar epimerase
VLGAKGFLGQELVKNLRDSNFNVLALHRISENSTSNLELLSDQLVKFQPRVVVNCMASWGSATSIEQQIDSNLFTPLGLFLNLPSETKTWLQCNSYFNKYFERVGVDKDDYSGLRRTFTELAIKISHNKREFAIHELHLPHLIGKGQRDSNLVSLALKALESGRRLEVGSGKQVIPVLSVADAAEAIKRQLSSKFTKSFVKTDVNPVEELTVRNLLAKLAATSSKKLDVDFDAKRDRPNEFYDSIFPTIGQEDKISTYKSLDETLGEI